MTDLIVFTCPVEKSHIFLRALQKDFYKPTNPNAFNVGEPFFRVDDNPDLALFFCPVSSFIGGIVKKKLYDIVFKGLSHSAMKGGFKLSRVKCKSKHVEEFERYEE